MARGFEGVALQGRKGISKMARKAWSVSKSGGTIAAKIITKNSLQRKCFEAIDFVKITKQSLYKANSLACFLAQRDTPVAAALQRKSFDGIIL